MAGSSYSDKTAGREDGLLKIRYANREEDIILSISFKQWVAGCFRGAKRRS
jgi:hypothetical protein